MLLLRQLGSVAASWRASGGRVQRMNSRFGPRSIKRGCDTGSTLALDYPEVPIWHSRDHGLPSSWTDAFGTVARDMGLCQRPTRPSGVTKESIDCLNVSDGEFYVFGNTNSETILMASFGESIAS